MADGGGAGEGTGAAGNERICIAVDERIRNAMNERLREDTDFLQMHGIKGSGMTIVTAPMDDDSYDHISSQILAIKPLPSVNKAISMVHRVEKQRRLNSIATESTDRIALNDLRSSKIIGVGRQLASVPDCTIDVPVTSVHPTWPQRTITKLLGYKIMCVTILLIPLTLAFLECFPLHIDLGLNYTTIGKESIGSCWVYRVTLLPDGKIDCYKAWLVAKVRLFLAIASSHSWPMSQLDVNNAFLHGHLNEEVYMLPPKGYLRAQPDQICRLKRFLYGLKQASRQWNKEFTFKLEAYGFRQSQYDHCLFLSRLI
ncbi:Retrovirus-related Pol polyprotein from transposon RE2 [Sesamum angolense]|uniref:Retrovirus-related Pol polyprotein from transposon RE2 n=1 Tax=Sesamum angolense TaxID=2727404 RepID=A0AAE1W387_9LAMI|nr:Retrovirus-related Pol polyprotein from transposon RE2 [Sesamum angolense]